MSDRHNPFLSRANLVRIPASQVRIGMFVAELDRPWLGTPFLLQGFLVREMAEIRKLQELCKYVYIEQEGRDLSRRDPFKPLPAMAGRTGSQKNPDAPNVPSQPPSSQRAAPRPPVNPVLGELSRRSEHAVTRTLHQEYPEARVHYASAKQGVKQVLEQARFGSLIDQESVRETVVQLTDSVLRNPDALLWMTRIKHMHEYTAEHCLNVCVLAIAFGRHLRLPQQEIVRLGMCGLLHDVGKMRVPDEILNKPERLTPEEYGVMQQHPVHGRDLLHQGKTHYQWLLDTVLAHHERPDGQGYPNALPLERISVTTRIVSIVDAFDAMTSERCYSAARSNLEALKEIYRQRDKQFDGELALEFIRLVGPYPPGTLVELRNGYLGIVLDSEIRARHLPRVKLVRTPGNEPMEPRIVDLRTIEKGALDAGHFIANVLKNGDRGLDLESASVQEMMTGSGIAGRDSAQLGATMLAPEGGRKE